MAGNNISAKNLVPTGDRLCNGTKKDGKRCSRWTMTQPGKDKRFCKWHQPDLEDRRSAGTSEVVMMTGDELDTLLAMSTTRKIELTLERAFLVGQGLVKEQVVSPRGDVVTKEPAMKDQNAAMRTFLAFTTTQEEVDDRTDEEKIAEIRQLLG
jgi:hypothetical protein